jgi:hypothetical protein
MLKANNVQSVRIMNLLADQTATDHAKAIIDLDDTGALATFRTIVAAGRVDRKGSGRRSASDSG